jgi:hypothetical protein
MLAFELDLGYLIVMAAFLIGAFVAWRKDYPAVAAVLAGFAVISVLRMVLYDYSSSMIK